MTGQQWAVVADRDKGDHPTTDDIYEGDRYTMQANRGPVFTDQLVRIERQVPTTDEPGEQFTPSTEQVRSHYVFDQSDRWDSERGAAFDRWLASVASLHPPTREQIAEIVYRGMTGKPWHTADMPDRVRASKVADALVQNGAER